MKVRIALLALVFALASVLMWTGAVEALELWMYVAIAIAASDQIYTRVYRGNNQYEEFTLFLTTAAVAALYLPPQQAVYAISIGSILSALLNTRIKIYKLLYNFFAMTVSGIAMVSTYFLMNTLFAGAIWPSAAAGVSLFFAASVFDTVNVWLINAMFWLTTRANVKELALNWERTLLFPFISGIMALSVGWLIEYNPITLSVIPVCLVIFLKPAYTLPWVLVRQ